MPTDKIELKIYKKYEKESSKLRMIKGGAWTINLSKLNINEYYMFVYKTKKYCYTITAEKALKYGNKMYLGNELKLVVAVKYWNKIKKDI